MPLLCQIDRVCELCDGSDKTARMCSVVYAFAAHIIRFVPNSLKLVLTKLHRCAFLSEPSLLITEAPKSHTPGSFIGNCVNAECH